MQDIGFLYNVQYDCPLAKCTASGKQLIIQERVESDLFKTYNITPEQTRAPRRKCDIPNGDALELPIGDEESLLAVSDEILNNEQESDQRKGGFSLIPQASTTAS